MIDCPTVAAAATAIPSSYFVPAVSTGYSISTVLDLYRCWIYLLLDLLDLLYRSAVPTDLFCSTVSTNCSTATATATATAVPTSYSTIAP